MRIEDLPVIRYEEITDQTKIVDIAEICHSWLPAPNENFALITELCYVLGKSKEGGIFVTDQKRFYHGHEEAISALGDCVDRPCRTISHHLPIKSYTSLVPVKEG